MQQSGSCTAGEELTEKDGDGVGSTVDVIVGCDGANEGSKEGAEGCAVGCSDGKGDVEGLSDGGGPKLKPVGKMQSGDFIGAHWLLIEQTEPGLQHLEAALLQPAL